MMERTTLVPLVILFLEGISALRNSEEMLPWLDTDREANKASYKRVPIPKVSETETWVAALSTLPSEGPGGANLQVAVDGTLRFTSLAYSRNDGREVQCRFLYETQAGGVTAIELQVHSTDAFDAGAHLVAYLYKLDPEVGVVLSYKGSTLNHADWLHNFKVVAEKKGGGPAWGVHTAHRNQDEAAAPAQVHVGFKKYKEALDRRMRSFDMAPLRETLQHWGAETWTGELSFFDWIRGKNSWIWCAVVGHSLGGAMANIAAADLAQHSQKPVMLATLGAPTVGNRAFGATLVSNTLPPGGLRIYNEGDSVTSLGYKGVSHSKYHVGRAVEVKSPDWIVDAYHKHLRYKVPSRLTGEWKDMVFSFPGITYFPTAVNNFESFNLQHYHYSEVLQTEGLKTKTKNGCACKASWELKSGSCMARYCCNPTGWGEFCAVQNSSCESGKSWGWC